MSMMLVWLLLVAESTVLLGEDRVLVSTRDGKVRGETLRSDLGQEVDVWDRIPFAEPPVGELRFANPRPVRPWHDVKNVTGKPNSCVQIEGVGFPGHPGEKVWLYNTPLSEDCLYLSITRPARAPANLPVMVWIYGGSFYGGTSTLELYDPKILATRNEVVFVAIQYRVASLGFLFLDNEDAPGNAGLMDQVMALKWIKNNIKAFGGDPNSITLFSESAGSTSVSFHLLSPLSSNLFNRAIMQSATALAPWALISKQEAKRRALLLARKMDCPTDTKYMKNIVNCMRAANTSVMVNMEHDKIAYGLCAFPFVPIVDGTFLPASPQSILNSGTFPRKAVLLGANQDEGSYFLVYYLTDILTLTENITVTPEIYDGAVREVNPFVKPVGLSAIKYAYTDWMDPQDSRNNARSLDRMTGDFLFSCSVINLAEAYAKRDPAVNVYVYHFRHRTVNSPWPTWTGVMHGDEIAYIFGDPFRRVGAVNYTDKERMLSTDMMTYWTNFAKTGDPNKYSNGSWVPTLGGHYWPIHSQAHREYLEIRTTRHYNKSGFKNNECEFWRSFLPMLLKSAEEPVGAEDGADGCLRCRCAIPREPMCPCSASSSLVISTFSLTLLSTLLLGACL